MQHAGNPGQTAFDKHGAQSRKAIEYTAEDQRRPLQAKALHLCQHGYAGRAWHGCGNRLADMEDQWNPACGDSVVQRVQGRVVVVDVLACRIASGLQGDHQAASTQ